MAHSRGGTAAALLSVSAVAATVVVFEFHGPARVVAGLALSLVLPGWAMTRALFPGRSLRIIEAIPLAAVLSLLLAAVGGLAMYAAGARLSRVSWSELGAATTVVAAVLGYLRRRRSNAANWSIVDTEEQGAVPATAASLSTRSALLRLSPLVLAVLLVAGAVAVSWRSAYRADAVAFTELSIVPAGPQPKAATSQQVVIGVICHENATTQYRVLVHGPGTFQTTLTARVRQGATWARTVTVPAPGTVTVDLYRTVDQSPYRTVHMG
ncbi:MAG TPA: DUF1616 domain-containing protein [Rugosimonospora sp.]|nr:DUF1616 domain-containing protein [Rugosimonospora sp.]